MKKVIIGFIVLMFILLNVPAVYPREFVNGTTTSNGVFLDTDCDQAKYYVLGTLCQDTDDGKLYKGTGAAVVELAAGASGDMTKAVYDANDDGAVDAGAVADLSSTYLTVAGTDIIKDTHIDWGSGAGQVDMSDFPASGSWSPTGTIDLSGATVTFGLTSDDIPADSIKDTHIDWGSGAGQVDMSDFPASGSWSPTGTINLSGATVTFGLEAGDIPDLSATYLAVGSTPTRDSLGIDTDDSPQFAGINVGHASDTTITRVSAGLIAVEGSNLIRASDVDDTPVNGETAVPVSSNWAYDHAAGADPHPGYMLESNLGFGANNYIKLAASPGSPDGTKFLRDDGTWVVPTGSGDITAVGDCTSGDCTMDAAMDNVNISPTGGTWDLSALTLTLPGLKNGATSAGFIRLYEDSDDGTDYCDLIGPTGLSANITLTLPNDDGGILQTEDSTATLTNKNISSATNTYRAASTTATGAVELATTAETSTGTDTGRAVTPDGLSGSVYGQKEIGWNVFASTVDTEVADGIQFAVIPASMNGMNLIDMTCAVADLNSASGGATTAVLRRVRDGTPANMVSVGVTISYNEYFASDETVDTDNDDIQTGDQLFIDVDSVTTGAVQKGLSCTAIFQTP